MGGKCAGGELASLSPLTSPLFGCHRCKEPHGKGSRRQLWGGLPVPGAPRMRPPLCRAALVLRAALAIQTDVSWCLGCALLRGIPPREGAAGSSLPQGGICADS